jgi:predicted small lipoprotein YifL
MRSRGLLAAALLVSAAACGARSPLRDPDGASVGAGGSSATATSATATSVTTGGPGPGGGPSFACPALLSVEPAVEVPTFDGAAAARDPLLQLLGTGGVLALVRGEATNTPDSLPGPVAAVRLEPWALWPPTLHPSKMIYPIGGAGPFVSGVEPEGTFALGVERSPAANPKGCGIDAVFGISLDAPGQDIVVPSVDATCDDAPVVIATAGDGTHLVAGDFRVNAGGPGSRALRTALLDKSGGLLSSLDPHCASTRFVGDTLPIGDGLLFVHSSSDGGSCSSSPELQGPARRLVLHRFNISGADTESEYTGSDDMVYARLLPGKTNPWLIFRESGASAEVQPPGMALPVGLQGGSGSAFPITEPGAGQMAVAALGFGLVVATVDAIDPSTPTIFLRVYSSAGLITAEVSFSTNGAWHNGDRLTLIASPDSTSFLVGWTGFKSTPGTALFVRRFDCVIHE